MIAKTKSCGKVTKKIASPGIGMGSENHGDGGIQSLYGRDGKGDLCGVVSIIVEERHGVGA